MKPLPTALKFPEEHSLELRRGPVLGAAVPGEKPPVGRDEKGLGQGADAEPALDLAPRIERDLGRHAAVPESLDGSHVVAGRDEQHGERIRPSERASSREERRELAPTRRAPRRPEVDEDEAPAESRERDELAVGAAHHRERRALPPVECLGTEDSPRGRPAAPPHEVDAGEERLEDQEEHDDAGRVRGTRRHGRPSRPRVLSRRAPTRNAWTWFAALLLACVAFAGCKQREERPSAPASSAPAQTFKGGPAAHPGDWCGGHGVPESECTRCNPELIPQFRARHDWCEEHGVPESQCTICHPELLRQGVVPPRPRDGRPAGEAPPTRGGREAPVSDAGTSAVRPGTTVRLARPEVVERVGIETIAAERRPLAEEVSAPVRLDFDPSLLARVSARVSGVVRTVPVALGTRVSSGDLLLTLDSAAAATTRADLAAATTRLANAETALRRAREIRAEGVGSQADIEAAETSVAAARAELTSLRAASALVGAGGGRAVQVRAPRDGVVVRRSASVGQQVTAEEVLVEVADLSQMWAILDVPDAEAPRLEVGQRVTITVEGIATPLEAPLAWLSPIVDPHTRTVQARVELPNADGRLRANAFGRARVRVGAAQAGVVVPRDALQRVGAEDVVFVARSPLAYEARIVAVALRTPRDVQLASGVTAGERVVTTGSFELKTELLRESIGAGCCDDEG